MLKTMRGILALTPLAIIAFSGMAHAKASLGISPLTQSVNAGDEFSFDVDISGAADVYAYQFDVSFNPKLVEELSSTQGNFLASAGATFFIPGATDNALGTVSATAETLLSAVPGASGSGILAQFSFEALTAGVSSITISEVQLLDSSFNSIDNSIRNGSINVTAGGPLGAPEIDPASAASAATLLFCGLAIIAGRRRANKHHRI